MPDNAKKVYTAVLLTLRPEQASLYLCFCILKASSCCLLNRKYQTMPDSAKKSLYSCFTNLAAGTNITLFMLLYFKGK